MLEKYAAVHMKKKKKQQPTFFFSNLFYFSTDMFTTISKDK